MAVLLEKPIDASEAAVKRRYMKGKESFTHHWWDAENLMEAIRANIGDVA